MKIENYEIVEDYKTYQICREAFIEELVGRIYYELKNHIEDEEKRISALQDISFTVSCVIDGSANIEIGDKPLMSNPTFLLGIEPGSKIVHDGEVGDYIHEEIIGYIEDNYMDT